MVKVSAHRLDRRITVQELTRTVSPSGAQIETWATAYEMSAEREPQSAVERFAADQTLAEVDTVFRTRYYPNLSRLDPKLYRVVYNDTAYNILGVLEIGRKEGLQIVCKSRGDTGNTP